MVNKAIRIVIVVSGILNWIVFIRNAFDGFHHVHKSRHASWDEMIRVQKRNYSDHHLLHFQSCSDFPVQTERLRRPYVSTISLIDLHKKYHAGVDGHFSPPNCVTKEKIAIIVPLHGRLDGCFILLNNLIPVLRNQNKDFSIFVIEQVSDAPFNKALLMNAGFVEAIKQDVFTCFIFHDEDLIPVTNSVPYECPFNQLHHLSVTVSSFNHTVQEHRVGGVVAMTSQLFKTVNGFSNLYFGHGYEVQDMFQRLKALNISTVDARKRDGIFVRIGDTGNRANIRNEDGLKLLDAVSRRPQHEGLNTLKVSVGLQGRLNVANVLTRKQISFDADYYLYPDHDIDSDNCVRVIMEYGCFSEGVLNLIFIMKYTLVGSGDQKTDCRNKDTSWSDFLHRHTRDNSILQHRNLPLCPHPTRFFAQPGVLFENITFEQLNKKYGDGVDGHFTPPTCAGRDKTAIIIPFRERHRNLTILLNNLIPVLRNRNKDFTIFVIEQDLDTTFNKALLMNAGFKEALKQDYFTCFIFHDVDYIPETSNVPYECLLNRSYHLPSAVSVFNYTVRYKFAGGVLTMPPHLFQAINGFSNLYFGWGFEDNDMYRRLQLLNNIPIEARQIDGRFFSLAHGRDRGNPRNADGNPLFKGGVDRAGYEGLNSVKYTVVETTTMPVCTWKRITFNASYYVNQMDAILKK